MRKCSRGLVNQVNIGRRPAADPARKTAYDLRLVDYSGVLVSVDARLPNQLLAEALEAKKLADNNIRFTDLTEIFINNSEMLYVDTCCHVDQKGYIIVAERICEVLRDSN